MLQQLLQLLHTSKQLSPCRQDTHTADQHTCTLCADSKCKCCLRQMSCKGRVVPVQASEDSMSKGCVPATCMWRTLDHAHLPPYAGLGQQPDRRACPSQHRTPCPGLRSRLQSQLHAGPG
jgi:hypothetical protein